MANVLLVPHQIFTGENALTEAGASICALGKKALIVTDPFMIKFGNVAMVDEMGIPTPAQFGIDKDAFFAVIDKMADDALTSGSPQNTWHQPSKEDLVELYKKLWD